MAETCDKYCEKCFYHRWITAYQDYCSYLFSTGHPRPCDPGEGCTARIRVKYKRHRRKKKND